MTLEQMIDTIKSVDNGGAVPEDYSANVTSYLLTWLDQRRQKTRDRMEHLKHLVKFCGENDVPEKLKRLVYLDYEKVSVLDGFFNGMDDILRLCDGFDKAVNGGLYCPNDVLHAVECYVLERDVLV